MTKKQRYLFFDTEMSGCDQLVSIGYVATDENGEIVESDYFLIKPRKAIRKSTIAIHGITTEQAKKDGIPLKKGLAKLYNAVKDSMVIVGFAPQNDILALAIASKQLSKEIPFLRGESLVVDVARLGTPYMMSKGLIEQGQTPNLSGLYRELFDGQDYEAHNALSDAKATSQCFWKLMAEGWFNFNAIIPYYKIRNLCKDKKPQKQPEPKTEPNGDKSV